MKWFDMREQGAGHSPQGSVIPKKPDTCGTYPCSTEQAEPQALPVNTDAEKGIGKK